MVIGDIELVDYTTIKASYEALNKKYRKNHRDLEKGQAVINRTMEEINNSTNNINMISSIDKLIGNLTSFRKKVDLVINDEDNLVLLAKERVDHLKELSTLNEKAQHMDDTAVKKDETIENADDEHFTVSDQRAHIARFYRLLSDHLFVNGNFDSAILLANSSPAKKLCLTDIYKEYAKIRDALFAYDTSLAHTWYQEAQYKLKKSECYFEFDLRIFEFYILLVRENRRIEALEHARKYIGSSITGKGYRSTKLGQAMVLFVMRDQASSQQKAEENDLTEKWIINRFHQIFLSFYEFSQPTPLSTAIKAGVTAIKTVYCYNSDTQHIDCVVCHPLINRMAKNLPFGRHENSVLNCQITNEPINENNPAMMLPNGHVYSQKGLIKASDEKNMVTCPRTGKTYPFSSAERVFIL